MNTTRFVASGDDGEKKLAEDVKGNMENWC